MNVPSKQGRDWQMSGQRSEAGMRMKTGSWEFVFQPEDWKVIVTSYLHSVICLFYAHGTDLTSTVRTHE